MGATIGRYMVDAYLLRTSGVAMYECRPNEFATDLPVFKLSSFETIKKLSQSIPEFG